MRPYFLLVFTLITFSASSALLTCDHGTYGAFPRTTDYSNENKGLVPVYRTDLRPGISLSYITPTGETVYCTPANCEIVSISFYDNRGTKYAQPTFRTTNNRPAWISSTLIPNNTTVGGNVTYRIKPADGSTAQGKSTSPILSTFGDGYDNISTPTQVMFTTDSTQFPKGTYTYQAPDQHSFGDMSPSDPIGIPLILSAPLNGSLRASIFWSGPVGTSMTGTAKPASQVPIPQGKDTLIANARQGLQFDIRASESALPGPISGNLTLTLTCP